MFDAKKAKDTCVAWIQGFFKENVDWRHRANLVKLRLKPTFAADLDQKA